MSTNRVAIVTGGAKRIGEQIVRDLHQRGYNLVLHYRNSQPQAEVIASELNKKRANSVITFQLDLTETAKLPELVQAAITQWGRLDLLINNASSYYPTPMETLSEESWDDLLSSDLKAPVFLTKAAAPFLTETKGSVVNILDVKTYKHTPEKNYIAYSVAKTGLHMATLSLAIELAPNIRVNAIAPGPILPPVNKKNLNTRVEDQTLLNRMGTPSEIAKAILFLAEEGTYTTGETISVCGGQHIT